MKLPFFFSKLVRLLLLTLQNCFTLFTPGSVETFIPAGCRSEVTPPLQPPGRRGLPTLIWGGDARRPGPHRRRRAQLGAQLASDHSLPLGTEQPAAARDAPSLRGSRAGTSPVRLGTPPRQPLGAKRGAALHGLSAPLLPTGHVQDLALPRGQSPTNAGLSAQWSARVTRRVPASRLGS